MSYGNRIEENELVKVINRIDDSVQSKQVDDAAKKNFI